MGTAGVKIKLMPSSLEANLETIKRKAKSIIEKNQGKNIRFEEESIAFGLKAIIAVFEIDETQELEPIENKLGKIEDINSSQVIDMRRLI